jgi:hypothetical protein
MGRFCTAMQKRREKTLSTLNNDCMEPIRKIVILGKKVGAQKISLLPYHEGGRSKSEELG